MKPGPSGSLGFLTDERIPGHAGPPPTGGERVMERVLLGLSPLDRLALGQRLVDLRLERFVGLSAAHEGDTLDLARVVLVGIAEHEARGAGGTGRAGDRHVMAHGGGVPAAGQALVELGDVEAQGLGVTAPGLERPLMLEQAIVHLPVLALFFGTVGSFSGLEGQLVDPFERQV